MDVKQRERPPLTIPEQARCPEHGSSLTLAADGASGTEGALRCVDGCVFPLRNRIPRFVPQTTYADAFGIQWNAFRRTQLDSFTNTTISKDRLTRCVGGSLDVLRGARVLEVGCGAGRFTEVLIASGASVFACDLSGAVDANLANCGDAPGYFVAQANALALPVAPRSFDFVVALGMLQHTPSPEETIKSLAGAVKPGGMLVVDHYATPNALIQFLYLLTPRAWLRAILTRMSPPRAFRANEVIVRALLPFHRILWRPGVLWKALRLVWRRISPVFDYYDTYPQLGVHLDEWAILDTHDALTDHYKHLRTPDQVADALRAAGLEVIESGSGGNGVEARARRQA